MSLDFKMTGNKSFCQMHRSWEQREEKLSNTQLTDYG